jgi:hypothetical protein
MSNKEANSVEDTVARSAMKLALEALNNSVDLVVEDAYNAEKLYGNYPTRQAKVGGLKALAEDHKKAIKALEEALASEQEQKRPQNCGTSYCSCIECVMDEQEQGEPVAWDGDCVLGHCGSPAGCEASKCCRADYTTPQQRKPLNGKQLNQLVKDAGYTDENGQMEKISDFLNGVAFAEAAHQIKE